MPANAVSEVDKVNVQVSGDVSKTSGELGYLQLDWAFPTDTQSGHYECRATGVTQSGQIASFSKFLDIQRATVNLDEVIRELQSLKKTVYEQQQINTGQEEKIAAMSAEILESKHF